MRNRRLCPLVHVNMHCRVTIDRAAFPPQQNTQTAVTEAPPLVRHGLHAVAQSHIVDPHGLIARGQPMFFAGIEVRGCKSLRKVKDGETVDDLFAFLTCAPNAEIAAIHPKAMPVILTKPAEWEAWLGAPFEMVAQLQRPQLNGALKLVDEPI